MHKEKKGKLHAAEQEYEENTLKSFKKEKNEGGLD
jgi:hypothetical protein